MKFLLIDLPKKYIDYGLLILRIVFGFSLIYGHGLGKVGGLLGPDEVRFADPFGLGPAISLTLAVFAEVICALLVMLGLFTRAATIPIMFTMLTAFFTVHLHDEFGQQEKAILYGFAFLAIFFTGPGKFSVDHQIQKKH